MATFHQFTGFHSGMDPKSVSHIDSIDPHLGNSFAACLHGDLLERYYITVEQEEPRTEKAKHVKPSRISSNSSGLRKQQHKILIVGVKPSRCCC